MSGSHITNAVHTAPALLAALGLLAGQALAQGVRPDAAGRLVERWDFEDREATGEPVPRHWFRSLHAPDEGSFRPGFPRYNLAELDDSVAYEGDWSVRLPTRGGSTSLVLARGVVATLPDSDLLVVARARTEGLEAARARVVARFLDGEMNPLPGSRFVSEAVRTGGAWVPLRVLMEGSPEAAWVQIELQLAQPAAMALAEPGPFDVVREDVSGAAWFDDLRIYQAPRMSLSSQSALNIVEAPEAVEMTLRVRDLAGEALRAELTAFDARGDVVDETTVPVTGRAVRWRPALERLGWHRVRARVVSDSGPVGQSVCDVAWVGPARSGGSDRVSPLGVVVGAGAPDDRLAELPDLVDAAGAGSLALHAWARAERALDAARESEAFADPWETLGPVVEETLERGVEVTFVLERAPEDMARDANAEPADALAALEGDRSVWLDRLGPMLSRFGERVRRWQVGAAGTDHASERADLDELVGRVFDGFFRLIPRPILVLPWDADRAAPASPVERLGGVTLDVDWRLPESAVSDRTRAWAGSEGLSVVVRPAPESIAGARGSAAGAARRAVLAWAAGARRIVVEAPWNWGAGRDGTTAPTALLPAWRTLGATLAGRSLLGELPAGRGSRVFIAGDPADLEAPGALIAWHDGAPEDAELLAFLGAGELAEIDLDANERPVATDGQRRRVALGPEPLIVEGIDAGLMLLRARMRFEPDFIETRAERLDAALVVANPWDAPISGRVRIVHPEGWTVQPRTLSFRVGPNAEQRLSVSVVPSVAAEAGPARLAAEVLLDDATRAPVLEIPLDVEVGLASVELTTTQRYTRGADGSPSDLVLTLMVTNTGEEPVSLDVFALAEGYAGREGVVPVLEPGGRARRVFLFDGAAERLVGRGVRVTLREQDGAGRLNRLVEVR